MRRAAALLAIALVFGCRHRGRRIVHTRAAPSVAALNDAAPETQTDTGPALDPCAPLRAEHAAAMAKALAAAPELDVKILPAAFGFCAPSGKGAWGLVVAHARRDPEQYVGAPTTIGEGVRGRFHLVHRAFDGTAVRIAPVASHFGARNDVAIGFDSFETGDHHHLVIEAPVVFDFDGDGTAEIVLILRDDEYESGTWSRGRVWTLREGKIVLYPPAKDLDVDSVCDVDGDGRPDLLVHAPFAGVVPYPTYYVHGPSLVAHSLVDGSFARDDKVATDAARAACAKVVPLGKPSSDFDSEFTTVACARLRGATTDSLLLQIDATHPKTDACEDLGCTLRDFAKSTPPFVIR
ncbi:MAG: FG-GAP repeat domain-containing protein [Polyangiales bacterium]